MTKGKGIVLFYLCLQLTDAGMRDQNCVADIPRASLPKDQLESLTKKYGQAARWVVLNVEKHLSFIKSKHEECVEALEDAEASRDEAMKNVDIESMNVESEKMSEYDKAVSRP